MDPVPGRLLVAAPTLLDPNFWRTVVLVAEHGEDGALGVVLNRPSEVTVGDAVPDLAGALGDDAVVHVGGPGRPTGVLVLAEWADPERAGGPVFWGGGLPGAGGRPRLRGRRPPRRGRRGPRPRRGRHAHPRLRRPRRLGTGTARRRA